MIPTAISDGKYGSWQEQELWDEYEFLLTQLKNANLDPEKLAEKIREIEKRSSVK